MSPLPSLSISPLAAAANLPLLYALVMALFLVLGWLLARLTRFEYDYAVSTDYLKKRRKAALEASAWLRIVNPIIRVGAHLAARLGLGGHRARIQRTLTHAGSPWGFTAEEFIGFALANALGVWLSVLVLFLVADRTFRPILGLIPAAAAYLLTCTSLKSRAETRRVAIDREMPFVLDLISLTMGAGSTFLQACETITGVSDKGPMEEELDQFLHEIKAGTPMKEAIRNMPKRSDSEELALMAAAVSQAEQLGTPLVEIFRGQAETNRFRRTQMAEKAAAKIPNKLAVPTVFLMLAVLLLLFGPIIIKAMNGGLVG